MWWGHASSSGLSAKSSMWCRKFLHIPSMAVYEQIFLVFVVLCVVLPLERARQRSAHPHNHSGLAADDAARHTTAESDELPSATPRLVGVVTSYSITHVRSSGPLALAVVVLGVVSSHPSPRRGPCARLSAQSSRWALRSAARWRLRRRNRLARRRAGSVRRRRQTPRHAAGGATRART